MKARGTSLDAPAVQDEGVYKLDNSRLGFIASRYGEQYGDLQYEYAIGTTPGATDAVDWTAIEVDANGNGLITGLHLPLDHQYFISVRVKNFAGDVVSGVGTADGILLLNPAGDFDGDGLTNKQEHDLGTNPLMVDTDGDGMPDGWEVVRGLNPLANDAGLDKDKDGYTNLEEYLAGTDPGDPNSKPGYMVWHVDDNIIFSGDGKTWVAAFKTIHEAVDAAKAGDRIWVKASTYSLATSVLVDKAIAIYGGFAGDELLKEERNWHVYPTTIDGQNQTECLNVSASATIDGFIITRCHGNLGGGALDSQGTITFANNQFLNNKAELGGRFTTLAEW